jgi:PST family polysaccharide transporter
METQDHSLGRRAISGFAWTGISQVTVQLIQFVVTIVLARLLFPEDYGLVGMAAVFTEAIASLSGLAFEPAIVQRKDLRADHLSTCFWTGILTGMLLFLVSVFAARPLALFYERDVIGHIVILSSIGFVVGPTGAVHRALLTRHLAFKKLIVSEVGATVSSAAVSILLAFLGAGPYSLVLGALAGTATSSVLMWFLYPWRPRFSMSSRAFRELFGYSKSVLGNGFVTYLGANIDYLLVGKFLGAHLLGLYTLAYRLVTIPLNKVSRVITRVTFPAFSLMQDNDRRLEEAYTRTVRLLSLISFPALVLMGLTARDMVSVLFGEKWLDSVMPVRLLVLVGMLKSVGTLVGSVVLAKGRPDLEFKWNLVLFPLLGLGIFASLPYGIVGVSFAFLVIYGGFFPIAIHLTNTTIHMKDARYYRALVPALCSSGFVVLLILLSHTFLLDRIGVEGAGRLASDAAVGLLGWLVSLSVFFPGEREELFSILVLVSPASVRFLYRHVGAGVRLSDPGALGARGLGR